MLAAAFLTITAVTEHARQPPDDQILLTKNEIARLLADVVIHPARDTKHRAQTSHYQRQVRQP